MNDIFKKIDHADILARRIENEINSENFDDAFYLTDTFIFLFSGHQVAKNKLLTSYTSTADKLFNNGRIDEAESLVLKALLLAPENSELLSIFVKIKNVQHQELRKLGRPTTKEERKNSLAVVIEDAPRRLIEGLRNIVSMQPIICTMRPLSSSDRLPAFHLAPTMGHSADMFVRGESIIISIKSPKKADGYLTVYHYDNENKLSMLLPYDENSQTFVNAGEEKEIFIRAAKPLGKQYIKVVWSSILIVNPKKVDYKDASKVASTISKLIDTLKALDHDNWMATTIEFQVYETV